MGFKFKLDSVLTFTLSKEANIKQEYTKVEAQHTRAINRMASLREELVKESEEETVDISLLLIRSSYNDRVKLQLDQQVKIVEALNKKVQLSKNQMLNILRERKTLENLKEKHKQDYLVNQSKAEQKVLDEQALLAFSRN